MSKPLMWRMVSRFSLDIPTQYPIILDKLDEEVKAAISTMQSVEGQRVQVTPANKKPLGNYGTTDHMQALDVTFHDDSVEDACVKATELL